MGANCGVDIADACGESDQNKAEFLVSSEHSTCSYCRDSSSDPIEYAPRLSASNNGVKCEVLADSDPLAEEVLDGDRYMELMPLQHPVPDQYVEASAYQNDEQQPASTYDNWYAYDGDECQKQSLHQPFDEQPVDSPYDFHREPDAAGYAYGTTAVSSMTAHDGENEYGYENVSATPAVPSSQSPEGENSYGYGAAVVVSSPQSPDNENHPVKVQKEEATSSSKPKSQVAKKKSKAVVAAELGVDTAASLQRRLGSQSKRGGAHQLQLNVLENNEHARRCWEEFAKHEEKLCDEWAAFYHSFSESALLYEVQAAVAQILFDFPAQSSVLPRIQKFEFRDIPDAPTLKKQFKERFVSDQKDHHPDYRRVAISSMCSLASLGPEASPPVCFIAGYSHSDDPVPYREILETFLVGLVVSKHKGAPWTEVKQLADSIIQLAERFGLGAEHYGGNKRKDRRTGHQLQLFIRRNLVDQLAYAAVPWGDVDPEHEPISKWLDGDNDLNWGQARVVCNPEHFLCPESVRMYQASADPDFHNNRPIFQAELVGLLSNWIGDSELRQAAIEAIEDAPPADKMKKGKRSDSKVKSLGQRLSWLGTKTGGA